VIRTNLSTRPFYNVRAVRVTLAVFGAVVLGATVFNAGQIVRLTASQRTVGAEAIAAEDEAERLREEAVRIRGQIDPEELEMVSVAAAEANAIIDQRTFSYTTLLSQLESTLPAEVRVKTMRPRLDRDGAFIVEITVESRTIDELYEFVSALEDTGSFSDVLATRETRTESGLIEAVVVGRYQQSRVPAAAAPSSAEASEGRP
jgi:hypothetical protein